MSVTRRRVSSSLCLALLAPFLVSTLSLASSVIAGEAAVAPDIAASLQPFVERKTLAGAVTLVATKDAIVSHQTVGFADIAAQAPMKPDSLFWIASMSKPLTGVALMMLVDEGKVDLGAPLAKYLPEFAAMQVEVKTGDQVTLKPAVTALTVRHVVSHTGGLVFLLPAEKGKIDVLPIADSVAQSAKLPLKFEPGSGYQYSNCGINAVGRIIEVVSGMSYERFMQERLFVPLGMKDTVSVLSAAQVARLAKSYKPSADKSALQEIQINYLSYPLDAPTRHPCPGGGYFSSASDLAAFGRMLLNGGTLDGRRYLSSEALKQFGAKQTGTQNNGYGVCVGVDTNGNGFGHGGAYATDLWVDTKRQLVTVYLVQHNGYAGTDGGKILPTFKSAALAMFGSN